MNSGTCSAILLRGRNKHSSSTREVSSCWLEENKNGRQSTNTRGTPASGAKTALDKQQEKKEAGPWITRLAETSSTAWASGGIPKETPEQSKQDPWITDGTQAGTKEAKGTPVQDTWKEDSSKRLWKPVYTSQSLPLSSWQLVNQFYGPSQKSACFTLSKHSTNNRGEFGRNV
jgi:hypothetical protein